jgi:ABC-type dipeptide/oligopeptide/nickel transport system ATPase component
LRSVDLDVQVGDLVGIVGESGSGKTSLVRTILGLWPPGTEVEAKSFKLLGADVPVNGERFFQERRGRAIGLIMQNPQTCLTPTMKVADQVEEVPRFKLGMSADEARSEATRYLEIFGLTPATILGSYPRQLSGGMRQRVASAAAMAGSRKLLIADEPTSALDVRNQERFLRTLLDAHKQERMTLILVSHDLNVVSYVCSTLIIMYKGSIVEQGPCQEIMSHPAHPFTRALVNTMDIEYEVPSASEFAHAEIARLSGNECPYFGECPHASSICLENPGLRQVPGKNGDHRARCWKEGTVCP